MISPFSSNSQHRKTLLSVNIFVLIIGFGLAIQTIINLPCGVFCMVMEPEACPATVQDAGWDNAQVDPAPILIGQSNKKGQ